MGFHHLGPENIMQRLSRYLLLHKGYLMRTPGKMAILLTVLPMINVSVQQISTFAEEMEIKHSLEQEFIHSRIVLI